MEKLFWYIDENGQQWGPFTYEESVDIDDTPNPDNETFRWQQLTEDEMQEYLVAP